MCKMIILIFQIFIICLVVGLVVILRFVSTNPTVLIDDVSLIYNFLWQITAAVVWLVFIIRVRLMVHLCWKTIGELSSVNIFLFEGIGLSDSVYYFFIFILELLNSLLELLKLFCQIWFFVSNKGGRLLCLYPWFIISLHQL